MTTRPRIPVAPSDLSALAEAVARWVDDNPHVWRALVSGSRVRGDHRPDSDLDVLVQPPQAGMTPECLRWWLAIRQSDKGKAERLSSLRSVVLPIALHLAQDLDDSAQRWASEADSDPDRVVLHVRKVACYGHHALPRDDATM